MTATPEQRARFAAKIRGKYQAHKASVKCAECGRGEPEVEIEFHHPDPSKKFMDISSMVSKAYSWRRIRAEIDECVPLCKDDHAVADARLVDAMRRGAAPPTCTADACGEYAGRPSDGELIRAELEFGREGRERDG